MAYNLRHLCQQYLSFDQWKQNRQNQTPLSQNYLPQNNFRSYPIFSQNIHPFAPIDNKKKTFPNFIQSKLSCFERSCGKTGQQTENDEQDKNFQQIKMKGEKIRQQILNESKEQDMRMDKMEGKIQEVLAKLKFMGNQRIQSQTKQSKLMGEQTQLFRMIKEAQRINICRKQQLIESNRSLDPELEKIKQKKLVAYQQKKHRIEQIEKRNCEQFEKIEAEMLQKMKNLENILRSRLEYKNKLRGQIQDGRVTIMNMRVDHEQQLMNSHKNKKNNPYIQNKIITRINNLENQITQKQADKTLYEKKYKMNSKRLLEAKMKRINNKLQLLEQIYAIHLRIKEKHMQMTATNLQVEAKNIKDKNLSSELSLLDTYTKLTEKKNKDYSEFEEVHKKLWGQFYEEGVQPLLSSQIQRLEAAVKEQQKRKRIIEDKYQKLKFELESDVSKLLKKKFYAD